VFVGGFNLTDIYCFEDGVYQSALSLGGGASNKILFPGGVLACGKVQILKENGKWEIIFEDTAWTGGYLLTTLTVKRGNSVYFADTTGIYCIDMDKKRIKTFKLTC
jgi:hypothetical protein